MLISRLLLKDRSWLLLLAVALVALLTSTVQWMQDHPNAICWDEAEYFNAVLSDQGAVRDYGLRGLYRQIRYDDRGRPPAYRILAIPFYSIFGFRPTVLRLASMGFTWLGLLLLYLTAHKIADRKCAVLSVLVCCLSPAQVLWSGLFYTENPLFLASAGTFYFLVSSVTSGLATARNWIGLGLSIGLGLLSKASFVPVAASVLGFAPRCRPDPWARRSVAIICHQGRCAGIARCGTVVVDEWGLGSKVWARGQERRIGFIRRPFDWHLDVLARYCRTGHLGTRGDHRGRSYCALSGYESVSYDETLG